MIPSLHVAAAAIVDSDGRILIARRPQHVHQGGLWEFPGGKIEPGEDVRVALDRELSEELGIVVLQARPLICIPYRYPDRQVLLDVWRVEAFSGAAHGREGQEIRWVAQSDLLRYAFPPPNRPIITALDLPDRYLITPEPGSVEQWPQFLQALERPLRQGVRLVQLRAKLLGNEDKRQLASQVLAVCRAYDARLVLNAEPELAVALGMDGVQLGSQLAIRYDRRPAGTAEMLLGVSCHTAEELQHAHRIGADFALLSPVLPTCSHPGAPVLGWQEFARLTASSTIPVYALGGMSATDISTAWQNGGQGIAAISGLW